MPAPKRLTLETVDFNDRAEVGAFIEQIMTAGMVRVRAEMAELQARGLMDSEGRLLPGELPEDMRPGPDSIVAGDIPKAYTD